MYISANSEAAASRSTSLAESSPSWTFILSTPGLNFGNLGLAPSAWIHTSLQHALVALPGVQLVHTSLQIHKQRADISPGIFLNILRISILQLSVSKTMFHAWDSSCELHRFLYHSATTTTTPNLQHKNNVPYDVPQTQYHVHKDLKYKQSWLIDTVVPYSTPCKLFATVPVSK